MLKKIQKRIDEEVEKIIKKETLTQDDFNILSAERLRLQYLKEQKEREKYTNSIYGLTEKLVGSVCSKGI
jgi:hypothetical protein